MNNVSIIDFDCKEDSSNKSDNFFTEDSILNNDYDYREYEEEKSDAVFEIYESTRKDGLENKPTKHQNSNDINIENNNRKNWFEKEMIFYGKVSKINVEKKTFECILFSEDKSNKTIIVFSSTDLQKNEFSELKSNSSIVLTYGKQNELGTLKNTYSIYVRPSFKWTKKEIDNRNEESRKIAAILNQ